MKKFAWILGIILLVLTLVGAACAKAPPAEPPEVTVEKGHLADVSVAESTVAVHTAEGTKTFTVGPQTVFTFKGEACTLEQLEELQASGGNFECTVVYDEEGNVLSLNVYPIPSPRSVQGTISDVNIAESTITVKTAGSDRVFDVDPGTGLLIDGVACSLELVNALVESLAEAGGALPCTVIYTADEEGKAVYIDIANTSGLIAATGTLTEVSVAKSTVTIMTDKGERTFEVDAKTGQFLNGEACSLEDYTEALEHGGFIAGCRVIYFTDKDGNLVYLDAAHTFAP